VTVNCLAFIEIKSRLNVRYFYIYIILCSVISKHTIGYIELDNFSTMFHIPLGYTSHSVSVHLPRSSTPIHALPTTCHWNIELIDWSDIPRLVRNDREYNNSHEKYANGKGRGSREKTKFLRSRFVARSVISPWKVQWKIAKERAGRGWEGGGKGGR